MKTSRQIAVSLIKQNECICLGLPSLVDPGDQFQASLNVRVKGRCLGEMGTPEFIQWLLIKNNARCMCMYLLSLVPVLVCLVSERHNFTLWRRPAVLAADLVGCFAARHGLHTTLFSPKLTVLSLKSIFNDNVSYSNWRGT